MRPYEYDPLDLERPAIRLLRLRQGTTLHLECNLFQAWLDGDDVIPYEALSYTWGATEFSASIDMDGSVLGVTENLFIALHCLRSKDVDRILWVDAVCINQIDYRERGHQVNQMANIYAKADRVLFWLGPGTDETDALMSSMKQLERESVMLVCKDWRLDDMRWRDMWSKTQLTLVDQHCGEIKRQCAGLEMLLDRPWFKRVWILQEVAKARRGIICCGTRSLSARFFALAPILLGIRPEPHCQAILDIMPGPSREHSWWSERRDLYTLLLKFIDSRATDPRDMSYALLGICSDAQDNDMLRADYAKSPKQVVTDIAWFLFGISTSEYDTIPQLMRDATNINTRHLLDLVKSQDLSSLAAFHSQRGNEVSITDQVTLAAAKNEAHGKEVMAFLSKQWGIPSQINDEVLMAAVENKSCGSDITALLLEQQKGQITNTGKIFQAVLSNSLSGLSIAKLLIKHFKEEVLITESMLETVAQQGAPDLMEFLLERQGERQGGMFEVTESLIEAAASNIVLGDEMVGLLMIPRPRFGIPKRLPKVAADNVQRRRGFLKRLFGKQKRAIIISEQVLIIAAANIGTGYRVMHVILKHHGNNVSITEEVLKAAAGNRNRGGELIKMLLEHKGSNTEITEEVFKAAAGNHGCGHRVLEHLFKEQKRNVEITSELFSAAIDNSGEGLKVIEALLQYQGRTSKVTKAMLRHAANSPIYARKLVNELMEQGGSEIDIIHEET